MRAQNRTYSLFSLSAAAMLLSSISAVSAADTLWQKDLPKADATEIALYQSGRAIIQQAFTQDLEHGNGMLFWRLAPSPLILDGFSSSLENGVVKALTSGRRSQNLETFLTRAIGEEIDWLFDDGAKRIGRVLAVNPTLVDFDGTVYVSPDARPLLPRALLEPLDQATLLEVEAAKAGPTTLSLRYQLDGLSWRADHIVDYDEAAKTITLSAGAILSNGTRSSYSKATLSLLAGQANRVQAAAPQPRLQAMSARMEALPAQDPAQDVSTPVEAGDLWRYVLNAPTDLPSQSERRVALMADREFPVETQYRLTISRPATRDNLATPPLRPEVILSFVNSEQSGTAETVGLPLPGGNWRVYAEGAAPIVLGEARLGDIAVGQSVTLALGRAFDITARALQTAYVPERRNAGYDATYRVTLTNAKSEDVAVDVQTGFPGQWTIRKTSHEMQKQGSGGASWTIPVPANGETVLTYEVTVRY